MPQRFRARILAFYGSWSSGLAALEVRLTNGQTRSIYCENAPTVRALDACFGNVIRPGHTVAIPAEVQNRELILTVDEIGILLGFTPVEDWTGPDIPDQESANGLCGS